ncbi:MAG: hypothetical protein ACR2PL_14390 [Dehalococcoidia bacterium]
MPPVTIDSLAAGAAAPSSPATLVPSPSPAPGVPVIYPAGWNIIGGPAGLMLPAIASGPFAFPPGATAYVVPAAGQMLQAGLGYWVLFNAQTPVSLPLVAGQPVTVQLPAGQYVLIGNPNDTAATVTGADSVLVYDPIAGAYQQTSTLAPGQGAWAISSAGGLATISPTATSPTTVPPTTTSPTPTGPVTVPPATTNPATP